MNINQSGEGRIEMTLSTLGETMSKGNAMFEQFWKAYPSTPRKGGKAKCKQVWDKSYCDTQAEQILKHINWLKTTEQWLKLNGAFIPAPLVYLNQQAYFDQIGRTSMTDYRRLFPPPYSFITRKSSMTNVGTTEFDPKAAGFSFVLQKEEWKNESKN